MRTQVLAVINDAYFGRTLENKLKLRRMGVSVADDDQIVVGFLTERDVDVVLLDIRGGDRNAMNTLSNIKDVSPETEIILIAGADDIALSMEGMRNGASDDITVPFDIDSLAVKIRAARKRKILRSKKKRKRSLFNIFEDAMVAATFAQAGEFESAKQIGEDDSRTKEARKGKDENSDVPD